MDSTVLKTLERWELTIIAAFSGVGAIYFSIFRSVPTAGNQWTPELRPGIHWPLLVIGTLLMSVALVLRLLDLRNKNKEILPPAVRHPTEAEEIEEKPEEHPAVKAYRKLTGTQKEIVVFRYDDCSTNPSIDLDQFFERFGQKNGPEMVGNIDEMYYRLKDLEHAGLIILRGVASHATSIGKIQRVSLALVRAQVIVTAGTKTEEG